MLELVRLTKRYGSATAVDGVSLDVARGQILALVGGSGSGKTTTLKMVNRLVEPSGGTVRLEGADVREIDGPALRRRIGYAFQEVGLFPHLSVSENVGITASLLGWPVERIRSRVRALLELVELDPDAHGDRRPDELSGGQQQRVGVARALMAEPEIVLFDEPFGALDPLTRERVRKSFLRVRAEVGLTGIFVTHDMVEALLVGDRIAVLRAGQLVQVGTPRELLAAPADAYVAELLESPLSHAALVKELTGARP